MTRHTYERWLLSLDVRADGDVPATATVRRVLKHLWRAWGLRCRGFSEDAELMRLRAENTELRQRIAQLAANHMEPPCTTTVRTTGDLH